MTYGNIEFASWITYNQGDCVYNDYIIKISIIFTPSNNGPRLSAIKLPVSPLRSQSCITSTSHIMICDTDGWIKTVSPLTLEPHPLDTIILLK